MRIFNLFPKLNLKYAAGIFGAVLLVLVMAPSHTNVAKSQNCTNPPTQPTLNYWPVSFSATTGSDCTDGPAITARNANGSYPSSQAELDSGINANVNDDVYVLIYVHNGAAQNIGAVANNVSGNVSVSGNSVSTTFAGSNTNSVSGSVRINIPSGASLQIVPGSGQFYNYQAQPGSGTDNLSQTSGSFNMGDMQACFEFSEFYRFKVHVSAAVNPTVTGTITGTQSGNCVNGLGNALISVTNTNVPWKVYVDSPTPTGSNLFASDNAGDTITNQATGYWVLSTTKFYLINSNTGNPITSASAPNGFIQVPISCGNPTGQFTITFNCGSVTWTSPTNVTSVDVVWQDITTHTVIKSFPSTSPNGSGTISPLTNGSVYYIIIYDTTNGGHTQVFSKTTPIFDAAACGQNPTCPAGSVTLASSSILVNNSTTASAPSGWSGGSFSSSNSGVASINGSQVFGVSQGSASISGNGFTAPNGATNCGLSPATINVGVNAPVCPSGSVTLASNSILVNNSTTASAPSGWSGGSFNSSNSGVVSINGSQIVGIATGSTVIGGSGFTAPNGATNCALSGASLTVTQNAPVCPAGSVTVSPSSINVNSSATASAPSGWSNGSFSSNNSGVASVNGSQVLGVSSGSAVISGSGFTAPNGATNCALSGATITVITNAPICPSGAVTLASSSILVNNSTTASAPSGWSNGSFSSSNSAVASINGSQVFGVSQGSAVITGSGFTAPNGATNCSLSGATINVGQNISALICSPANQNANTNTAVFVSASGGTGSYTWSAPSSNNTSGNGNNFATSYQNAGDYSITVTSGSAPSQSCGVHVTGSNICVANTLPVLSLSTPVLNSNNVYTATLTWSSTGGHNVNVTSNIGTTGIPQNNVSGNGSQVLSNLQPGVTYTFYLTDVTCNSLLTSTTVYMPQIQNNNNNIINTCVNNSCNYTYYYYNAANQLVPYNQYSQLSITKTVRNSYGTGFQNSVSANNGDTVQFEVTVTNVGSATANNVRITDSLPSGLTFVPGSMVISGGGYNNNNNNNYNYNGGNNLYNGISIGTLGSNQSVRMDFQATVNASANTSLQNTATASSDNAGSVSASAWVFVNNNVLGGNVNLNYSKRAFNDTKNVDAQSVSASREDLITYTLTVSNTGNTPANSFIITDDLSQVLPYADVVDNGGGSLSGNVISFPGITVPAGGSVVRTFRVRVKYSLSESLSYVMSNTYGNTVTIRINKAAVLGAFVAPKTGADTNGFLFATFLTMAAGVVQKRKSILKLIFT